MEWESWEDETGRQRERRVSEKSKNELFREMLQQARANQVSYRYVAADCWFASKENMAFIKSKLGKEFILPLKANRNMATSLADKLAGRWKKVETIDCPEETVREVWLEGVDFPCFWPGASLQTKMTAWACSIW